MSGGPVHVTRPPSPALAGSILRLSGYDEGGAIADSIEAAPLHFPLIFSFGAPWRIGIGGQPAREWPFGFAAGLHPGPVPIGSPGTAACVQVDLTPAGAVRLFGGMAAEMASRMVDLDLLPGWGREALALRERLAEAGAWSRRLDLAERFVAARLRHQPRAEVAFAWTALDAGLPVAEVARRIGWSPRHLGSCFRAETGIAPVTAARMLRFHRALRLVQIGGQGWAGVALDAGYADQAHLIRDFHAFAGETPGAWAARR